MAGDWIKMRAALTTDPKVAVIGAAWESTAFFSEWLTDGQYDDVTLSHNALRNAVIGALHAVWCAVNEHASDGCIYRAGLDWIDRIAGHNGFGLAMESVGWVRHDQDKLVFPKFEENNTSAAERQRKYRERRKGNSDVTRDVTRDVTPLSRVTHREEKRRVDKRREEDNTNFSGETASPSSPPVLVFPCDGKQKTWDLTQAQIDEWSSLYPKLGILDLSRQALAWVNAKPDHRKTAGGMKTFLVRWFNRNQDSGKTSNGSSAKPERQTMAEILKDCQ